MKKLQFSRTNILLLAVIIVLAILLLKGCFGKKVIEKPDTVPTKVQVKEQSKDEALNIAMSDSFTAVINTLETERAKLKKDLLSTEDFVTDLLNQQNDLENAINMPVPDTCKAIQALLNEKYTRLKNDNTRYINNTTATLKNQDKLISTQNGFLKEKDRAYNQLKSRWDTCITNAKKLEDYADKVKPKRGIYAGVIGMGNTQKIYEGVGITLGLMNRKGTMYEIGAIQMGNTTQYTVGLKTRLFKF